MSEAPEAATRDSGPGKVVADQSVSLDGFSAGPNVRIGNGMGDGGEELHEWMFGDAGGAAIHEKTLRAGAFVVGRRMFDVGEEPWGDEPPFHGPVFVATHRAKDRVVKRGGTTYTFVTDGVAAALERAKAAAGGGEVLVLGGAELIRECLRSGLLDELRIHVAPVFLGAGTRLFDRLEAIGCQLELLSVADTAGVAHLTYRATKTSASPRTPNDA